MWTLRWYVVVSVCVCAMPCTICGNLFQQILSTCLPFQRSFMACCLAVQLHSYSWLAGRLARWLSESFVFSFLLFYHALLLSGLSRNSSVMLNPSFGSLLICAKIYVQKINEVKWRRTCKKSTHTHSHTYIENVFWRKQYAIVPKIERKIKRRKNDAKSIVWSKANGQSGKTVPRDGKTPGWHFISLSLCLSL